MELNSDLEETNCSTTEMGNGYLEICRQTTMLIQKLFYCTNFELASQEEESTSGASTTDSNHRTSGMQPTRLDQRFMQSELREYEEENKR